MPDRFSSPRLFLDRPRLLPGRALPVRYWNARRGFTLVELLVVISVIGVLIALSMPAMNMARASARNSECINNLRQIWMNTRSYVNLTGRFPTAYDLGNYGYRIGVGRKRLDDPRSLTETYGLQALLEKRGSGEGSTAGIFVCPDQPEWMRATYNTYAFSVAGNLYKSDSQIDMHNQIFLWDNFNFYPGEPGFRGPFGPGYTVPVELREYPHQGLMGGRGYNALYRDGSVKYLRMGN